MRLLEARPGKAYQLWLRFDDGAEGTVDLADLAGRGVFRAWEDRAAFEAVRVSEGRAVEWPGDLDLCADALYLRLTGKAPEDLYPTLGAVGVDA